MPKVQDIPHKKCLFCLYTFPLTVICSPPFCFPPLLIFSSSPWHIWITYHFPDCAPKKVKHSLPFSFLTHVKARSLPVVAKIDPGQRLLRTQERKPSKISPLRWMRRLIWPCACMNEAIPSYKIVDMHPTSVRFQILSESFDRRIIFEQLRRGLKVYFSDLQDVTSSGFC